MDKLLADLLATATAPLMAALNRNSDNLERVIAGQEAAMAKLEGATGTTARKPRQTAAEKAAAASNEETTPSTDTPAATEQPLATGGTTHPLLSVGNAETKKIKNPKTGADEDTPTANYRASDFSRDQVKNEFIGWLGETDDADVRKDRSGFVAAVGQHFGVKQPFHPTDGLTDDEQRKQTLFFLRRKREGLAVDFGVDYDFDADPLADQTVADEEEDALG